MLVVDGAVFGGDLLKVPVPDVIELKPRWMASMEAARFEAEIRNCPILVVYSDAGHAGFDTVWRNVYSRAEFLRTSEQCVLLIALSGDRAAPEKRTVDGVEIEWDPVFQVPRKDRLRLNQSIEGVYVTQSYMNPLHLVLDTIGTELSRFDGHELTGQTFVDEIRAQQKRLGGEAVFLTQYRDFMVRIRTIVEAREKQGHAHCFAELDKLCKKELSPHPSFQGYIERLKGALTAEGERWIEEADKMHRRGQDDEARKLLLKVIRSFRGRDLEIKARKALEAMKS